MTMEDKPDAPYLKTLGDTTFLRFLDCEGRPRSVNIDLVNGWSPDNFNASRTAIFTANAGMPIISPYPVEAFDSLGIKVDKKLA